MPGLINAHTHGHGALAKGMGDLWNLELLINAGPYLNGYRSLEDKYLSGLLGGGERGHADGAHLVELEGDLAEGGLGPGAADAGAQPVLRAGEWSVAKTPLALVMASR